MVAEEGIAGWVLSKLSFFLGSGLSVPLVDNSEDTGSDLAVNDGLVMFTHNVDREFMVKTRVVHGGGNR